MEQLLETAYKSIATREGIYDYEIQITGGSLKGDGYLGIITAVDVVSKDKDNSNKIISLITKSAPTNPEIRKKVKMEIFFGTEIHAYEIFRTFNKFEIGKGLTPSKIAPKFYEGLSEYNNEFLIMENLKTLGFKQHETTIPLDKNHASLVMSQYGRLHALSFALRDQQPKEFNKLLTTFDASLYCFDSLKSNYMTLLKRALELLNPSTELEAVQAFSDFLNNINSFIYELSASNNGEHTAFLHGDCWMNNLMFKYNGQGKPKKPTNVRFYDYQNCRAAVPVLDLAQSFYTNCPVDAYNSLDDYLNIYYESFSAHVRKLGSDPSKLYPFNVLKEQWKRYARYTLIMTSLSLQVMAPGGKKNIDLKQAVESDTIDSMFTYESSDNDMFNTKMRAIILHFVQNKFL